MDCDRREALVAQVVDARAHSAQAVDQVADRPLVHARHAGEPVLAARHRQRRGEGTKRGTRIAEKQICFLYGEIALNTGNGKSVVPSCNTNPER